MKRQQSPGSKASAICAAFSVFLLALFAVSPTLAGPVVIMDEGFEMGPGGINGGPTCRWISSDLNASSGFDYWGVVAAGQGARVASGQASVHCAAMPSFVRRYDHYMTSHLTTQIPINVAGMKNIVFEFSAWSEFRSTNSYDKLQAMISTNGTNWVTVRTIDRTSPQRTYIRHSIPLSLPTTTTALYLKFLFLSNASGGTPKEGVYLDDVFVIGTPTSGGLDAAVPVKSMTWGRTKALYR